jgi:DNA replication and repair protein RecF
MSEITQFPFTGIRLYQFKKHQDLALELGIGFNCWLGNNGSGKTNALDALHYLCLTKSFFHHMDALSIHHDCQEASIKGVGMEKEYPFEILVQLKRGGKKIVKYNEKEWDRLADHIGRHPIVMIAPQDSILITEGSEERRKWMDSMISQVDKDYLNALIKYQHLLTQRNALLKKKGKSISPEELESYDWLMNEPAKIIHDKRALWINELSVYFDHILSTISQQSDKGSIRYEHDFNQDFITNRQQSIHKDMALERTTTGPHKDDLDLLLNEFSLKKHGSQGQIKSYLLALKLAQFQMMERKSQKSPLLLMDDIYDRLDAKRVHHLLLWLQQNMQGQVVITDTDIHRIPQHLLELGIQPTIIHF